MASMGYSPAKTGLAAVRAAPFTHMRAGAMKKLERTHPELLMEYCERKEIVKLLRRAN